MTDRGDTAARLGPEPLYLPPVTSPTTVISPPTGPVTTVLDRPQVRPRRVRSHARPDDWSDDRPDGRVDAWVGGDPEGLFAPVVQPAAPHTPGLGYAFGPGRRIPRRPEDPEAAVAPGPAAAGSAWAPPERVGYAELQRAVDAVFEQEALGPSTVELIRPYVEHVGQDDGEAVWAGVGVVPPPTPVTGVARGSAPAIGTSLPTRRQLREQRRAEQSARSAARNRLAKGGVLAMAMFGAVATQAPQALHDRLFASTSSATTVDVEAATLAGPTLGQVVDTGMLPRDGVEATLRNQLIKQQQVQQVSEAAQSAGGVLVAVAKAQAASDQQARQAALARATREAQRNPKALARMLVAQRGWSSAQFTCLDLLWTRESTWNYRATNPSSGAYGIPQALPGGKMASAGSDWRTNPATQITWGLGYIAGRYGTPCGAWNHSEANNWY